MHKYIIKINESCYLIISNIYIYALINYYALPFLIEKSNKEIRIYINKKYRISLIINNNKKKPDDCIDSGVSLVDAPRSKLSPKLRLQTTQSPTK